MEDYKQENCKHFKVHLLDPNNLQLLPALQLVPKKFFDALILDSSIVQKTYSINSNIQRLHFD